MVVHAANESSEIGEYALYFASMLELKLLVKVSAMLHGPELRRVSVNDCSVSPQLAAGADLFKQEVVGVPMAWMAFVDQLVGQLAATDLFAHHQAPVYESRLHRAVRWTPVHGIPLAGAI